MALRAVVAEQRKGIDKQKNVQAEGRNRRALKDIGNLVPVPPAMVEGGGKPHISRPITRNFVQKQQAEKNSKKSLVTAISSDDDQEVKNREENPKSGRKQRAVPPKKNAGGRAYTSMLTARSKAAARGISNKPRDVIVDIDAEDIDNELAAVEYIEDIYKFYKETEVDGQVRDYMDAQPDINAKMRAILVDWLIEVHRKFELMPESLYLTVNIVDRFLSLKAVPRKELQLVGMGAMLIACKYEEIWAPEVNDFIAVSDNAYARDQLLLMEKAILGKLEWYLTVPTPYVFLVRYIKASVPADTEIGNTAFFLAELGLVNYSTATHCCPSKLAASAVYAARCTLNKTPFWTETLKHHTGYSEDQIMDCAKVLVSFHSGAAEIKLKAAYKKYSDLDKGAVALFPPAKTLLPQGSATS
ncbi:hypothetical protein ACH5RR_009472 [Cinchona calisaya]|uniref:B-like cyclin n=1 Tax=Cinchona calisaya TaxID=153742 RepID=A0ABD3AE91_9GENT